MKKAIYDPCYIALVGRLKARRQAMGLHQATVAAKLGHTNRWLSQVETMAVKLDVMALIRVCRVLGLHAHSMVRRVEEELAEEDDSSYISGSMGCFTIDATEQRGRVGVEWCSQRYSNRTLTGHFCIRKAVNLIRFAFIDIRHK